MTGLEKIEWISGAVPNIGLNVTFMVFGAAGLAFNIFTRWVHTSLFIALLIYQPRSIREHRIAERDNVFKQLFKRLQESATERTEPFHTAAILASIPGDGASANLLVIAPDCGRIRDRLLRVAGAVFVCLGSNVRASSGKDNPCACHQDGFPIVGRYLGMEPNRCLGRQSPQAVRPVSFGLLFVLFSLPIGSLYSLSLWQQREGGSGRSLRSAFVS